MNIETASIGDPVVGLLRLQIVMPMVVSAIETPSILFEEQTGQKDSIENGADAIRAPSILSSWAVAAVGPRTT
jgi:hypothetical protein